jgi:hypothetical protein
VSVSFGIVLSFTLSCSPTKDNCVTRKQMTWNSGIGSMFSTLMYSTNCMSF